MAVQRRQCCVPLRRLAARGVPGEGAPLAAERSGRPSRVCRSVCPETGSERAGGGAAALLLAGFSRLASTGRVELPFGVLAFPCALPAHSETVGAGAKMLVATSKRERRGLSPALEIPQTRRLGQPRRRRVLSERSA
jgi:hypothetical protein